MHIQTVILGLFLSFLTVNGQENAFKIHTIAFYNLENLFDTINNPETHDELSPIMKLKFDRQKAYKNKIAHLAHVIADIGFKETNNTPSLLGVCEAENRAVLEDLVKTPELVDKSYGIIHYDSPDYRGIDVALLYQKELFNPLETSTYTLKIYDEDNQRIYTRDQLLVSGYLEHDFMHIIVNHWPSRRGGKSESKRVAAARLTKHITDSLQQNNPDAKILIMGDFNDNPTDKSIYHILNVTGHKEKVALDTFYNPYMKLYKKGLGTTAYRDSWSLFDQIMMTSPYIKSSSNSFRFYKAGVFNKKFLITKKGRYKGYPFRSWKNERFSGGYSDHFPVYIYLIKPII